MLNFKRITVDQLFTYSYNKFPKRFFFLKFPKSLFDIYREIADHIFTLHLKSQLLVMFNSHMAYFE